MSKFIHGVKNRYLHKDLDLRVRLFNVLALAGTLVGAFMALLGIITRAGWGNVLANVAGAVLAFVLLRYSLRTGRYQQCYFVSITAIFLFLFPLFFFSAGGYHSGMPAFFVFAVAFTVFMLDGRRAIVMALLETCVYIAICVFAYRYPQFVNFLESEQALLIDIIVAFVVVSAALGATMHMQFRLYREQQRLLAEQNKALDQINQLKTEFLGNVSHELKTPLTVMMGISQNARRRLEEHSLADELIPDMKLLASEADRLSLMVGQVLDITRIEEGRMAWDMRECSVEEIIQSTVSDYYPLLKKNGNRLIVKPCEELPEVQADAHRLSQVLVNLLQNAIRHTLNGTITISAREIAGAVEVTVADTGEGIEPERLPLIFERFTSRDSKKSRSGKDTGTGLGLYICKHIVETHGGEIAVESKPGSGTTVRFTIPLPQSAG